MAIPKISDLSLLAAIRQFSEPAAWAELEQLLGLGVGTTEARDGWTENDWARRDYQVMLMLEVARKRPILGALLRWAQLNTAFRARPRSGEAGRSPDKRVAHRPPTQRNNAKLAIKNLYPQGVPLDLKRDALTTEVNEWLGKQKLGTVSADTIDRALGLRR